jgi:TetR/AcrR family transcriptional repressor of nem operon
MSKPGVTKEKLIQIAFDMIWDNSYSTVSVGDICERAGVNKGSFYHFFESKAELAMEAHEHFWQEKRGDLDRIFSPQNPPLDRIRNWCRHMQKSQREKAEKYGRVCGCPFVSIGAEIATFDEKLRAKSEELMNRGKKYIDSAIADAIRSEEVTVTDVALTSQRICSVVTGMMVEAKVHNNLALLDDLEPAIMGVLGVKQAIARGN